MLTRDLTTLTTGFSGELVRPHDAGYDERRAIWNRMVDRRPALFARCRSADDARRALAWARENELRVSIMGGGHNVAGSALVVPPYAAVILLFTFWAETRPDMTMYPVLLPLALSYLFTPRKEPLTRADLVPFEAAPAAIAS